MSFAGVPLLLPGTGPNPPVTPFPYTTLFRSSPPVLGIRRGELGQAALDTVGEDVEVRRRVVVGGDAEGDGVQDRKSTRLNSSHPSNSYDASSLKKNT